VRIAGAGAGVGRQMKARPWFVVAVVAIVAYGVACSGGDGATPTASPIPTPVYHAPSPTTAAPTFSPTPVPTPDPSVLAIRACNAEDLVVQFAGSQGAVGNVLLYFRVANLSVDACRVRGVPSLVLISETGESTVMPPCRLNGSCLNAVIVLEAQPVPQTSNGPFSAGLTVTYGSPAFAGKSCPGDWTKLAIELPDSGGRIDLAGASVPACTSAAIVNFATPEPPTATPDPTVGYR
jgi:hypothetical protein